MRRISTISDQPMVFVGLAPPRRPRGRPRKIAAPPAVPRSRQRLELGARAGEAAIANWCAVGLRDLRAASRQQADVARARQLVMLLLHRTFPLTMSRMGLLLGRDRTTIRHGLRLASTDPRLTSRRAGLEVMESALRHWAETFADRAGSSQPEGR
jgi:hypothetical protein